MGTRGAGSDRRFTQGLSKSRRDLLGAAAAARTGRAGQNMKAGRGGAGTGKVWAVSTGGNHNVPRVTKVSASQAPVPASTRTRPNETDIDTTTGRTTNYSGLTGGRPGIVANSRGVISKVGTEPYRQIRAEDDHERRYDVPATSEGADPRGTMFGEININGSPAEKTVGDLFTVTPLAKRGIRTPKEYS